jgi:hypothetical protein
MRLGKGVANPTSDPTWKLRVTKRLVSTQRRGRVLSWVVTQDHDIGTLQRGTNTRKGKLKAETMPITAIALIVSRMVQVSEPQEGSALAPAGSMILVNGIARSLRYSPGSHDPCFWGINVQTGTGLVLELAPER